MPHYKRPILFVPQMHTFVYQIVKLPLRLSMQNAVNKGAFVEFWHATELNKAATHRHQ
jgi:hypothetical protein